MGPPRAAALLLLVVLLSAGAAATSPTDAPQRAAMSSPDPASALPHLLAQGLAGGFVADGRNATGRFVTAQWDAGGLWNWTVGGDRLLDRVAVPGLDEVRADGRPVLHLSPQLDRGITLVDAPHAVLVAAHPEGVLATLPEGAAVLRQGAHGTLVAVAGRALLLAGPGLGVDGLVVRASTLWAQRIEPAEAEAALALPLALSAWVSPAPGNATVWASPALRNLTSPDFPPRLRLTGEGAGIGGVRVVVGRLADPRTGPVVLRPDGSAVPEVAAANLSAFRGLAVNVTATRPPVLWLIHDQAIALDVTFRLDVLAPAVVSWERFDLRHDAATLRAIASEHVLGRLEHWPVDRPERVVASVTPQPARQLDFPLLALQSNTTYAYRLTVTDFAGNNATTAERTFTTLPAPDLPRPALVSREPAPDSAPVAPVRQVRIGFTNPAGTFDPAQHLRLFVDKREVSAGITVLDGTIAYAPDPPLGPGLHTVGVVLRNSLGGAVEDEWRFTAAPAPVPGAGAAAAVLLIAAAAWLHRRT